MKIKTIFLFITVFILGQGVLAQEVKDYAFKIETVDTIFNLCDEIPAKFPDGRNGWLKYLNQNLQYPPKATAKGLQAVVKIKMTIEIDGHVSNVKALNNPGNGFAKEAERVVTKSPNWIPATLHNKRVTYCFVQPIIFSFQ